MPHSRITVTRDRFLCPKLGRPANLIFKHREGFCDESAEPVTRSLDSFDCDGRLFCGITPQYQPGRWGMSDWKECVYPNLTINGVR